MMKIAVVHVSLDVASLRSVEIFRDIFIDERMEFFDERKGKMRLEFDDRDLVGRILEDGGLSITTKW